MQSVLKNLNDNRLRVYFIWLPCIRSDDRASALERSNELMEDPRVYHFWDGERYTGLSWDKVLNTGQLAWDVYLIYGASTNWQKGDPPLPDFWMHQLMGIEHAPTFDVSAFESKVRDFMNRLKLGSADVSSASFSCKSRLAIRTVVLATIESRGILHGPLLPIHFG